jgi:hypothetical protein
VDKLKGIQEVDFNQGLSATFMTPYHASRLAELDVKYIRLAWDHISLESQFGKAWSMLRSAGFPASKVSVYVLIGFHDTPADALYRLNTVRELGSWPFPMRYQPVDTPKRNSFVFSEGGWTNHELVRYCRYWANQRITSKIPFAEFRYETKSAR